jgi:hypothetical protein
MSAPSNPAAQERGDPRQTCGGCVAMIAADTEQMEN